MKYDLQVEIGNISTAFTYNQTLQNAALEAFKSSFPLRRWRQYGFFEDDYISHINPHWLKFPPPGKSAHTTLAVLYAVIMTLGVVGNCTEIFLFARRRSLRTPANMLIVNLAISDLLMMCKMPIFIYNSAMQGPALGDVGCRIYGFVGGLTGTASICTLAAIAVDRYRAVSYPFKPFSHISTTNARRAILFIWLYSLIFSSIPLTNSKLGSYVPEGYLTSCSFDYLSQSLDAKLFILSFFTAAWIIPFIFITFSYTRILMVIKSANRFEFGFDAQISRHRAAKVRNVELKVSVIAVVIICVWFAAWTPYAIVALLGVFGRSDLITPFGSMVPALFCKTASCIDPFLYAIMHPRFRTELKGLFWGQNKSVPRQMSVYSISVYRKNIDEVVVQEPLQNEIVDDQLKCRKCFPDRGDND